MLISRLSRVANEKPHYVFRSCSIDKGLNLVFAPDGKIYWCTNVASNKGVVGEYRDKIFLDEEKILSYVNHGLLTVDECKKCEYRYVCVGGCVLYNIVNNNDTNSPVCGCFKYDYILNNINRLI